MRFAPALLLLPLAACSFGGKPPRQLLTLSSSATLPAGPRAGATTETITVLYPTPAAAVASNRVPVYESATSITYVPDARWVDSPARQFQRVLSETIAARSTKLVLDVRQTALDPGVRLSGSLLNFGIDVATGQALVTYDAVLTRRYDVVASRRFEARAPVEGKIDALTSAAALNVAANSVANEVADWVK